MSLRVYDPNQVVVSFASILLQGFADGEFVKIENMSDAFTSVVGVDGEVTRSKNVDRRAKITVMLMQSSSANDLLSALHNLDLEASNGAGVGAFVITDLSGRAVFRAAQAWITKAPDASFDREAQSREWVFECAEIGRTDGGN